MITLIILLISAFGCSSENELEVYLVDVDNWEESYTSELSKSIEKYPAVYDDTIEISIAASIGQFKGYWTEARVITTRYQKYLLEIIPPDEAREYHSTNKLFLTTWNQIFSDGLVALNNNDFEAIAYVISQMNEQEYERGRIIEIRRSLWGKVN